MFNGVVYIIDNGVVFTRDDVVFTKDDDPRGTPWKAKIREFIYLCSNEEISANFFANYYKQ
jgi:hypothetical protein